MRDLSNAVRLTSALSAVLVIVASLSPRINDGNDAGGYPIMFSWHPVFMTIGLFLLTQGLVSYISTFGSKVDEHFPDRNSRRVLHGSCQIIAMAFMVLGYLTVLSTHSVTGRSNLGQGSVSQAYTAHTWLGYITMVLLLFQVGAGLRKFVVRTRDDKNSNSFHGVLGPLIYAFTVATSIAGFNALIPDQVIALSVTALLAVLFVFYGPVEMAHRNRGDNSGSLDESNTGMTAVTSYKVLQPTRTRNSPSPIQRR